MQRRAMMGRTVTVTTVTESNTSVTGDASSPNGSISGSHLPFPSRQDARTAIPNTVLLCDSEFTGVVPVGTTVQALRYSTVLLVAISTRKLTNATTCHCPKSSSRFDLLCQCANALANVLYNTYCYYPWKQYRSRVKCTATTKQADTHTSLHGPNLERDIKPRNAALAPGRHHYCNGTLCSGRMAC